MQNCFIYIDIIYTNGQLIIRQVVVVQRAVHNSGVPQRYHGISFIGHDWHW